jgi:hypothetical protein
VYDGASMITNNTGLTIVQVTGINNLWQVSADAVDSGGIVHPVVLTPSF